MQLFERPLLLPDQASRRAGIPYSERRRSTNNFGNLLAPQLRGILDKLDRGEPEDWVDLNEFVIGSEGFMLNLYSSRISRVVQAEYMVTPNKHGDQALAKDAADFISEGIGRVTGWRTFMRESLHAIGPGFQPHRMAWDYDRSTQTFYVPEFLYHHPHRFRYDDQWQLRLYDRGQNRSRENMYGEALMPNEWVIHTHKEQAGYPNVAGVMRSCIYHWMFHRWGDKFWARFTERFGSPFVYLQVVENATDAVRAEALSKLEQFSNEHVGVVEAGNEIKQVEASVTSGSTSQHEIFIKYLEASITKAWLGASDVTEQGATGSQAAVETRVSALTDPKMVNDGLMWAETIQGSYFRWMLENNRHKFGGKVPPIPEYVFKTASDEIETDSQDLADQNQDERESDGGRPYDVRSDKPAPALPTKAAEPVIKPSSTANATPEARGALNGAQVSSLIEITQAVVNGQLPRANGVKMMRSEEHTSELQSRL